MSKETEIITRAIEKQNNGKSLIDMTDEEFERVVNSLPVDKCQAVLNQFRDDKNFEKKILDEQYRGKNPFSFRYTEAERKIAVLNKRGPALKAIIESKTK